MIKSKLIDWDIAEWLTRVIDHVTSSDQHDWYYCTREDDNKQYQTWEDNDR